MSILRQSILLVAIGTAIASSALGEGLPEVTLSNSQEPIAQSKRKSPRRPWQRGGGRREILRFMSDLDGVVDC